jgi:hypothetical protein
MMHMVIRAIVYARTRRGALAEARRIFDRLTDGSSRFDWYVTFDEDGKGHTGRDRWGRLPVAARADTEQGKRLIDEGWRLTRNASREALAAVRGALQNFSDAELLVEEDLALDTPKGMFRFACARLGEAAGSGHWLYDCDGVAIHTDAHLADALDKWRSLVESEGNEDSYRGLGVWVVPADIHY